MNRNNEFNELVNQLDDTPPALRYTLERAKARRKSRRQRRAVLAPLGSIATVFAVFVLMVNFSPAFAKAAGSVPFLKELVEFVSFSHSLSAAVDNDYVQIIGQSQTQNGIEVTVEYIIVDRQQLHVFYSLNHAGHEDIIVVPDFSYASGADFQGVIVSGDSPGLESGALGSITVDTGKSEIPDSIIMTLILRERAGPDSEEAGKPEILAELTFTLEIDPTLVDPGQQVELYQEIMIGGQRILLKAVEINPTHMRLSFYDDPDNTAWLENLIFYVKDENGNIYQDPSSSLSALGSFYENGWKTFIIDTPYFDGGKRLTLYVTGASWLDKDAENAHINLEAGTAEGLPEGISLDKVEKIGSGWELTFTEKRPIQTAMSIWTSYSDPSGQSAGFNGFSVGISDTDGQFIERTYHYRLKDYPYDEVWLEPRITRAAALDEPIAVTIK